MKWLVVGAGSIGAQHIDVIAGTEGQEIACVEPNEKRWDVIGDHCKGRIATHLPDALRAGVPDVALIATPTHLHLGQAIVCANAGCHVIIEKPIHYQSFDVGVLRKALGDKKDFYFPWYKTCNYEASSNFYYHMRVTDVEQTLKLLGRHNFIGMPQQSWYVDKERAPNAERLINQMILLPSFLVLNDQELIQLAGILVA